jgi:hypothetical protein
LRFSPQEEEKANQWDWDWGPSKKDLTWGICQKKKSETSLENSKFVCLFEVAFQKGEEFAKNRFGF